MDLLIHENIYYIWNEGEWNQECFKRDVLFISFYFLQSFSEEIRKIDNVKNKFQPYAHFKRFVSGMGDFSSTLLHINFSGGEIELVMDTVNNKIRHEKYFRLSQTLRD